MSTSLSPQAVAADFTPPSVRVSGIEPGCEAAAETPTVALAAELARLIEGQRQFAEEFGLPYERVFSDGFESFKDRDSSDVIAEWLAEGDSGAAELARLFDDLVSHQLALIGAIESLVAQGGSRRPSLQADRGGKPRIWARLLEALRPRRPDAADPTVRYLSLVAPAFVAAYARQRETLTIQQQ